LRGGFQFKWDLDGVVCSVIRTVELAKQEANTSGLSQESSTDKIYTGNVTTKRVIIEVVVVVAERWTRCR
jgi:hypothetical protein